MNKRDKKQNINAAPAETAPADTAPTAAPIETNAADGAVSANTAPAAAPVETAAAPETAAPQGTPAPRKVFIKPKGAFKAPPKQPAEAFVQSAAPKEPAAPVAEPAPTAKKAEPKTGAAPKKPAPAKESETGAAPKKPAPAKEPETADEIRFRRDLEAVKETFVSEEPITEKLNALLELNRAAGDILLGRLDDAVGELEKVKAAFLDLPADNAEAGELIYYGYGEEVVSSVKSIAVQEFLLTREIVFAENAVIEKAAYAFQLAEAKDGILEGSRGQDARRAAQNISEMSDRISRMRPGSIDRMNAEGHLDRALNSLLQLKIGDFIAFPRVVRSKEPRKTPPPVKAESGYEPLFASKQDKPDVAKAFSRESDKPDRETERRNLKHDED
ncbi:MAG: hypothetical protein LBL66_08730, partial [Clostridiales bacterium]|nr:hypothetical protein [Clostridiales bacterium]